jgi:hypothetical protein
VRVAPTTPCGAANRSTPTERMTHAHSEQCAQGAAGGFSGRRDWPGCRWVGAGGSRENSLGRRAPVRVCEDARGRTRPRSHAHTHTRASWCSLHFPAGPGCSRRGRGALGLTTGRDGEGCVCVCKSDGIEGRGSAGVRRRGRGSSDREAKEPLELIGGPTLFQDIYPFVVGSAVRTATTLDWLLSLSPLPLPLLLLLPLPLPPPPPPLLLLLLLLPLPPPITTCRHHRASAHTVYALPTFFNMAITILGRRRRRCCVSTISTGIAASVVTATTIVIIFIAAATAATAADAATTTDDDDDNDNNNDGEYDDRPLARTHESFNVEHGFEGAKSRR